MTRRAPVAPVSVASILTSIALLCGCGFHSHDLSTQDQEFVSRMIPHHELGMRLIDDATTHSFDVRLRRLVFEMSGYHDDELKQLHSVAEHDHVSTTGDFPGSLSVGDLERLATTDGPAHDTWWLHLMIVHHEGALRIASEALSGEVSDELSVIAKNTLTIQSGEISDMRTLLTELCDANTTLPGC